MAIEIVLNGRLKQSKDRDSFSELLVNICSQRKIKINNYGDFISITVCPEGEIVCNYEGDYVSISSQTNIAGPGFHAYVTALFDDIITQSGVDFEIIDLTKYYEERNFETLKYNYFYRWLLDMRSYVLEHENEENLCLCLPIHKYIPMGRKGYLATPMGYKTIEGFLHDETEDLAENFFIWNDVERDAMYYRNCALNLLSKDCFYAYSSMNERTETIAKSIIDYIELAHDLNPDINLPMDSYKILCESVQHECMKHEAKLYEDGIGYRYDDIYYYYKNWYIPVSGFGEEFFDEALQSLSIMAPYKSADEPWQWMMKADIIEEHDTQQEEICIHKTDEYYEVMKKIVGPQNTIRIQYILHDESMIQECEERLNKVYYSMNDTKAASIH